MSEPSKLLRPRYWTSLLSVLALACGVDERALQIGPSASGGMTGAGDEPSAGANSNTSDGGDESIQPEGGTAGTGSETNAGGEAEMPPPALPPLVDGCADLDSDGVSDCSVTLIRNATFQTDTSDWTVVGGGSLAWDARNALSDGPSGCALVTAQGSDDIDGTTLSRASQCVQVAAGQLVIAYANARVEASGVDDPAQAQLQVSYFDAQDCSGTATGYFVTPPSVVQGAWVTIQAGGVTGTGTRSALVELVGIKPNRAESLSACFDNVMVKTKAL